MLCLRWALVYSRLGARQGKSSFFFSLPPKTRFACSHFGLQHWTKEEGEERRDWRREKYILYIITSEIRLWGTIRPPLIKGKKAFSLSLQNKIQRGEREGEEKSYPNSSFCLYPLPRQQAFFPALSAHPMLQ